MIQLIKEQREAILELQKKIKNFGKDGRERKAKPEYFSKRINQLDAWWIAFEARHQSLSTQPDEQQPYFRDNLFASTKELYLKHRNDLQEGLVKVAPEGFHVPPNPNEANDDSEDDDSDDDDLDFILDSTLQDFIDTGNKANSTTSVINGNDNSSSSANPPPNDDNNGNGSNEALPRTQQQAIPINIEGEILKVLYTDTYNLIKASQEMDSSVRHGMIKAQLEMLRESWSTFRQQYFSSRASNNPISLQINMQALQKKYTKAIGHLNELTNHDSNGSDLPKLKIPEFSGKPGEWKLFIELFNKIVHEKNISTSIKMEHLKANLKGQAARLVQDLTSADQYDACLKILYKRYDNRRQQLGEYIDKILQLPRHKNESSYELRMMHDVATETMLSIKNLGFNTDSWDPMVCHILIKKLHDDTIKHYECQLNNVREPPLLKEFLAYIENRSLAIQSVEAKNHDLTNDEE